MQMDRKWKLPIRMQIVSETVNFCYSIFWFTDRQDAIEEKSAHQHCERPWHVLSCVGWVSSWGQHVETAHCLSLRVQVVSMLWAENRVRFLPTPFSHKGAGLGSVCWVYPSNYEKGKASNMSVPPACYGPSLRCLNAGCHYKHKLHSIFKFCPSWHEFAHLVPGWRCLITSKWAPGCWFASSPGRLLIERSFLNLVEFGAAAVY